MRPQVDDAPAWMRAPCPKLRKLERKVHSQREVENKVTASDKLYDECRIKHQLLVKHYQDRDKKLKDE